MADSISTYESLGALIDRADTPGYESDRLTRQPELVMRKGTGGSAVEDWPHALRLAREGWADVRPQVDEYLGHFTNALRDAVVPMWTAHHDVTGGAVDVGAYLQGVPECMVDYDLRDTTCKGQVIAVHISAFLTSGNRQEDVLKRGAAIVTLCDLLAMAGYSTEITAEVCVDHHSDVVMIKRADEMIDADSIMFALAHPAFCRRIVWSTWETDDTLRSKLNARIHGFYGMRRNELRATPDDAILIDSFDREPMSYRQPLEWIKAHLRNIGCLDEAA